MNTIKDFNGLKELKKALLRTHEMNQVKSHFHFRSADVFDPAILQGGLTARKALSEEGQQYMQNLEMDFLDTVLMKAFEMGQQHERRLIKDKLNQI